MDRRVKVTPRTALLAAVAAASLLLTSCSPTNLIALLTDEVKLANNKYLIVEDFTPANSATDVNPGQAVKVQFDRPVDMATVSASTVQFSPMTDIDSFDYEFNSSTNTLSILAYPLFSNETTYTVTLMPALHGSDGSTIRDEVIWSYETGTFPNGGVKINGDAAYVTNTDPVTLTVTTNDAVTRYRTAKTEGGLAAESYMNTPGTSFPVAFSLDTGKEKRRPGFSSRTAI